MAVPTRPPMQTSATTPPVKSQREAELETQLQVYEQELQKLADKNYLANIKDDTFFRIELLTALNNQTLVFKNFLDKLEQSQTGEVQ